MFPRYSWLTRIPCKSSPGRIPCQTDELSMDRWAKLSDVHNWNDREVI